MQRWGVGLRAIIFIRGEDHSQTSRREIRPGEYLCHSGLEPWTPGEHEDTSSFARGGPLRTHMRLGDPWDD
jgi:hypothetical protein